MYENQKRKLGKDTVLKMTDFIIKGAQVMTFDNRQIMAVEAVKLDPELFEFPNNFKNKYYDAANIKTMGISAPIWQELFQLAFKKNLTEKNNEKYGIDWEVEKFTVQRYFVDYIDKADMHRLDFKWGNMVFKSAAIVLKPGESYYFPKEVCADLRMFLEGKVANAGTFGVPENSDVKTLLSEFKETSLEDYKY